MNINIATIKKSCQKICATTKKNIVLTVIIAVIIISAVVGALVYKLYFEKTVSAQEAGQKAIDYINENYLKDTGKAELKEAVKFSSLYKILFKLSIQGQDQDQTIYITKDGKYAFPEMQGVPINLDEKLTVSPESNAITSCESVKKTDKPSLEAFVVSKCPYGLQAQRILAKLVKDEPSVKENIKVKYIGSITDGKIESMHGDEEAQENLRQICLREETNKYWSYVSCYIKEGKSDSCLTSTGVDKNNLNACISDKNRGLKYAEADFTLANQYGVQGSPELFINNDKVDEFSFGGRTENALKSIICCASNNEAGYCSKELSKESAATGLSVDYSTGSAPDTTQGSNCNL